MKKKKHIFTYIILEISFIYILDYKKGDLILDNQLAFM